MADADEDTIPRHTGGAAGPDGDLDDETQDFRFLVQLSKANQAIPKRGEKDFEPHHTSLQSSTLEASREAMRDALSVPRVHAAKGRVSAVYSPAPNGAWVEKAMGVHFKTMGQTKKGKTWLHPEEALYLLERGSLDIRWPDTEGDSSEGGPKKDSREETDDLAVPMSLQGAYAAFIGMDETGQGDLTLERYNVYAALRRLGYSVFRAEGWDGSSRVWKAGDYSHTAVQDTSRKSWTLGLFTDLLQRAFAGEQGPSPQAAAQGPLVQPGLYRNYIDVYRQLSLIPSHNPHAISASQPSSSPLSITYNVHKPTPQFRKTAPGEPDFRIAVVSARETRMPTLPQLHAVLAATPPDPPPEGSSLYHKLKHGYRNVVLAIVDQGVISYVRVADAAFGQEKIYERVGRPPTKKGGRRGKQNTGRG